MDEQIFDETARLLAAKYKILNRDQAYYLVADRYIDVVRQALDDGTTDPRALVRIVQDELRAEADWWQYQGELEPEAA